MESRKRSKNERVGDSQGKAISSFKVFMSCIKMNPTNAEDIDVSQVFSMNCFQFWLSTRLHDIKHPQQSFQRALYAHIRGADGRKPFPEDVEKALLKELREESSNLWTKMFGENVFRLGKKGFKRWGYHEAKKRKTEVQTVFQNLNSNKLSNDLDALSAASNFGSVGPTTAPPLSSLDLFQETSSCQVEFNLTDQLGLLNAIADLPLSNSSPEKSNLFTPTASLNCFNSIIPPITLDAATLTKLPVNLPELDLTRVDPLLLCSLYSSVTQSLNMTPAEILSQSPMETLASIAQLSGLSV